jgi:hypothetical protein
MPKTLVTQRTKLEIFNNPNDLRLLVEKEGGKYHFKIGRGVRGHRLEPMVTSMDSPIESSEGALKTLEGFLREVRHTGIEYYRHDEGFDHSKVLGPELISQILVEFRQNPDNLEVWTEDLLAPLYRDSTTK